MWISMKSVLSNRGLGINTVKCQYKAVIIIVPMALYGAETYGMINEERIRVNVLEMTVF